MCAAFSKLQALLHNGILSRNVPDYCGLPFTFLEIQKLEKGIIKSACRLYLPKTIIAIDFGLVLKVCGGILPFAGTMNFLWTIVTLVNTCGSL